MSQDPSIWMRRLQSGDEESRRRSVRAPFKGRAVTYVSKWAKQVKTCSGHRELLELRQICWAHLRRDFQKLVDRGGPADAIGRVGLEVVTCLFADWWEFRRGELDRAGLCARIDRIARELQGVLESGRRCADPKAATFLRQPLGLVSGVVAVRDGRWRRTHEQSCRAHPSRWRAVAEERLRMPQRRGVPVRRAHVDGGSNPAVARSTRARLPVPCDRRSSIRPARSATTGPSRGLNGYQILKCTYRRFTKILRVNRYQSLS